VSAFHTPCAHKPKPLPLQEPPAVRAGRRADNLLGLRNHPLLDLLCCRLLCLCCYLLFETAAVLGKAINVPWPSLTLPRPSAAMQPSRCFSVLPHSPPHHGLMTPQLWLENMWKQDGGSWAAKQPKLLHKPSSRKPKPKLQSKKAQPQTVKKKSSSPNK